MTSIVSFSDIHGQYSEKLTQWFMNNPADILLFAGDLQRNSYDDGSQFLEWINKLPYKYKICIFGNHDSNWESIMEQVIKYDNITFLNNESTIIEGIKIWGSPYSLTFLDWWFMKSDKELEEVYKTIPNDVDIIMTHTPAFGILDMTKDGILTGSMSLLNRIKELKKLKYHICGHIHEQSGTCTMNKYLALKNVHFINTSVLNEKYQLVHDPQIFEI
jgi:Icc-related predicted phosphoesterase